jgi:pimeloyl-ACP methyl ester carboxylesterase
MSKMIRKIVIILGVTFSVLLVLIFSISQPDIPVETLKVKYANESSRFITIKDMPVHYRDEGNVKDSIPLILLHGTSSSLLTWDACAIEWSKTKRVVRMDLPGFGLTGPNPSNDYSIAMYVDFLNEFLQSLKIDSCYLAGNSLGGLIAYDFAATHPEKVKKVILLDPAGYPVENAKGSLGFTLARIPVVNQLLTIVTPKSVVRKSLEDVYGDPEKVSDELVQQYHDMTLRFGNRKALLVRLKTDQQGDTTKVSRVLQPSMIIWGDRDQLIPLANAYKFQRDLPNDTLVVLPGVGHVPMEEVPELIIPLINQFIRQ